MSYLNSVAGLLAVGRDRTPKPPQDLLPNLALDIILVVADHLPLLGLLHLAQTCSRLREKLLKRLRLEARRASKQELLECLTVAAQACPTPGDTPHRRALACPRLRYIPLHSTPRDGDNDDDDDDYQLHHHHVQLALKYSRLKNPTEKQRAYLQQLLAPHARTRFRINPHDGRGNLLKASYILTPKIVKGRFRAVLSPAQRAGELYRGRPSHTPTARLAAGQCTVPGLFVRPFLFGPLFLLRCRISSQARSPRQEADNRGVAGSRARGLRLSCQLRTAAWDSRQHSIVEHMVQNRLLGSERSPVQELYKESGLSASGDEDGGEQNWSAGSDSWANRAMASHTIVLPGDTIDDALIPTHPKKPLRLGPGLRHDPSTNEILPTVAGQLVSDPNKNAIRVETSTGRYLPRAGELVIGTVSKSAADVYYVHLSDYTAPATLPQLSFEGATKKTRPVLAPGALVYARVTVANKHMDAELECVSSSTGKSEGLGPLTGGMLFPVSLGLARRLMMPKAAEAGRVVVLEALAAAGLQFETATGRNGRFWVDSASVKTVLAVGRAVQETDERMLGVEEQQKLVKRLLKELS
ncbi:exosome complex exonuclease RRP40 [Akanthomyces lecanii RCEF 1005]|uniref:Ribosomal RNA-processing protein 40 n=1 Tax=Akanthomyces lecanii RCEF 1005 TaxID=1081108 RepID=A0A162JY93_CORDF|nr:exosome complex exonuclease RRP40 [Akanthomyces lecanii RCEF 1005]